MEFNQLFQIIEKLVMCHSPSGNEQEIDGFLLNHFAELGVKAWKDKGENIIAEIPGQNPDVAIAITAHKDEIGAIVSNIESDGRVRIRNLGGSFPWVYGEGVVDLLADNQTISGILSFGSRHVSHESPQKCFQIDKALTWENAWVETMRSPDNLEQVGVRPGTRVVVGKHRKKPVRMGDYIASYTLDNKASVAILLELAKQLKNPPITVYLVASAKEEVGAIGALYFTNRTHLDALIALEICPLAAEYSIESGDKPVLLSQDGYGIYDEGLNAQLRKAAKQVNIPIQSAIIRGFGSDASIAMKFGHIPRAACLSFPTQNTHGFEIAHLGAIYHCIPILVNYCQSL